MGVPSPSLCEPLARVLNSLGVRRGMVVCGSVHVGQTGGAPAATHVDEISTLGPTAVAEFYENGPVCVSTFSPAGFPLQQASLEDLKGGESELNARILRSVLRGEDRGPRRDVALLNAGAALFVAGKARTITDGFDMASDLVDSGTAARKLEELAGFRP
jgi:anthranilate phosphoribosyltransferase